MNVKVYDYQGMARTYTRGDPCPLRERDILAQQDELFQVMSTINGELFDPHIATANVHKHDNQRGGFLYNLCKCSKACWESYVQFLRTRNRRHMNVAKRRFIDG